MKQKNYDTVSEAVNDLQKRGYTTNFSILTEKECLMCHTTSTALSPDEFEIDEIHRFDGMSNPEDDMIVYAVSSLDKKIKGTIVNAYGAYADGATSKIVSKLHQHV